jgi:hypothetical protein
MVLSTAVWVQFAERKMNFIPDKKFQTLSLNDEVLFYTKARRVDDDDDTIKVFVQGLQSCDSEDRAIYFNSKKLCISPEQYRALSAISEDILSSICAISLEDILPNAIRHHSSFVAAESTTKVRTLYSILNDFLTLKIAEIGDCEACFDSEYAYGSDCAHTCIFRPRNIQCDKFGILALSLLDFDEIAIRFCAENANRDLNHAIQWETLKEYYMNDLSFYDVLRI